MRECCIKASNWIALLRGGLHQSKSGNVIVAIIGFPGFQK
jgi:hypothetical protein